MVDTETVESTDSNKNAKTVVVLLKNINPVITKPAKYAGKKWDSYFNVYDEYTAINVAVLDGVRYYEIKTPKIVKNYPETLFWEAEFFQVS